MRRSTQPHQVAHSGRKQRNSLVRQRVVRQNATACETAHLHANPQSGRGGIRTFAKNPGKYAIHLKTGTESGTVGTENGPIDAILSELITLWPQLAASVREAVLQQATQSLTRGP